MLELKASVILMSYATQFLRQKQIRIMNKNEEKTLLGVKRPFYEVRSHYDAACRKINNAADLDSNIFQ